MGFRRFVCPLAGTRPGLVAGEAQRVPRRGEEHAFDCARILARATDHEDRIVACDRSGDLVAPHGINGGGEEVRSSDLRAQYKLVINFDGGDEQELAPAGETNIGRFSVVGRTSSWSGTV